jgi:hypothetical protein
LHLSAEHRFGGQSKPLASNELRLRLYIRKEFVALRVIASEALAAVSYDVIQRMV